MRQEARLVDLLSFTRDGEWGNGEPTDGYSPALVVRGTDFSDVRAGKLTTLPIRYIRSDVLARKAIVAGDTLIETAGGTKDQPTGRSVFIPISVVARAKFPLICASFARFLRPDPSRIEPHFLFWKLQDEYVSRRMFPYHVQHTGVARFQYTQFAETHPFVLPELPEQRAIASVLGALDDKIELNRRMNETLEAMARAIFKDWFVDFGPTRAKMEGQAPYLAPDIWSLFPDRLDDEGKPEGWIQARLGEFTELQNGYAFKSADWQTSGVPVVKIGSIKPSVVDIEQVSFVSRDLANSKLQFKLNVGDVLVGLTGYVGETGRVPPTSNPPMLNQRVGRFSSAGRFSPFVYACSRQPEFKKYAEAKAHGSAQPNISTRDILSFPVIRSTKELVNRFEKLVAPLFDMSLANLGETTALSETRDFLLPKLMSGEISIRDSEQLVENLL